MSSAEIFTSMQKCQIIALDKAVSSTKMIFLYFSTKMWLLIRSTSLRQMIHVICCLIFSEKNKQQNKTDSMSSAAVMIDTLMVNCVSLVIVAEDDDDLEIYDPFDII